MPLAALKLAGGDCQIWMFVFVCTPASGAPMFNESSP